MVRTLLERDGGEASKRSEELSEESLNDFSMASKYGNKFAKQELVRVNPYAKMCNAMLKEYLVQYKK
jgi:hypothetical protein